MISYSCGSYLSVILFVQESFIISKLDNRKDIRISTLIDYINNLGIGLEITAYPRNSAKKEFLLRV